MRNTIKEDIERIKSLLNINEQIGSRPCKQPNDIKTTSGETQIIGYIYDNISKNVINFDKCKPITSLPERNKCIEEVKLHSKQMSDTMNFLIDKRDNGTQLNLTTQKIIVEYEKYLDKSRLDYYYNSGTCIKKSTIKTN